MIEETLPVPMAAFASDGSIAIGGVMLCRTKNYDVWRFACPFCCSLEAFHDVRTTWKGCALDVPACSPSQTLSLLTEAEFDEDGNCVTRWPNRFLSYRTGILWAPAMAKDLMQMAKPRMNQCAFNFSNDFTKRMKWPYS